MAAAGGAGIGGAMLTMWGAGVAGTNINYSYVEFPNEDAEKFLGFKGKDNPIVLKDNWKTLIEKSTSSNDYYGAISTSCMAIMFPHMPFHWGSHFKLDNTKKNLEGRGKETLKVNPQTTPSSSSPIQGCAGMVMSRKGSQFLFTSEVSIRKGNRGISLWTAAKSSSKAFTNGKAKIKIRQFISFFEWSNGDWRTKGGYSWGGKELELESWTVKGPNGQKIGDEFNKNLTKPASRTDTFLYSVWTSGDSGESPFSLESETWFTTSNPFSLNPLKAQGYGEADAFMEVKDSYDSKSQPWKQYCANKSNCSDGEIVKLDVKDNLNTWFAPFGESKGTWKARPTN